jgi:small subunit ribosomal protein S9
VVKPKAVKAVKSEEEGKEAKPKKAAPAKKKAEEASSAPAAPKIVAVEPVKPKASEPKPKVPKVKPGSQFYGTGKRKNCIARVWLMIGDGKLEINDREGMEYLRSVRLLKTVQQPMSYLSMDNKFDIMAKVKGGGISGQAGAIKAGISKALVLFDQNLHAQLKTGGFLTRDARIKERKHYGHKRARKSFQFSKR